MPAAIRGELVLASLGSKEPRENMTKVVATQQINKKASLNKWSQSQNPSKDINNPNVSLDPSDDENFFRDPSIGSGFGTIGCGSGSRRVSRLIRPHQS